MKLNHLNLPIADVGGAREFFSSYFGFRAADEKLNDTICVMRNDDGFTLVLMSEKQNSAAQYDYPDAFHIGFFLDEDQEVNEMYEKLKGSGAVLTQEPKRIRRSYGFYFRYQGIMIEVAVF